MKHLLLPILIAVSMIGLLSSCNSSMESSDANLTNQLDSLSYSFGYLQGGSLANEGIDDVDVKNYVAGLNAAFRKEEAAINDSSMQVLIQEFFAELQTQQMERQAAEADINIEQGRAFLEENVLNSDVFETGSGLQYRVIEEGDGASPAATDQVQVHYEGSLLSDEVFDSSYDRGEPITFPLNRVIPGWTEGVQLMSVGSKYQFFIPSNLAYGNNPPQGSIIPPGAVLIFEVELLDIVESE
ncbi:MAG: FKBP-type peptidyl-prolyl cis-trans isomerase [Balneolaceae bacterium]